MTTWANRNIPSTTYSSRSSVTTTWNDNGRISGFYLMDVDGNYIIDILGNYIIVIGSGTEGIPLTQWTARPSI